MLEFFRGLSFFGLEFFGEREKKSLKAQELKFGCGKTSCDDIRFGSDITITAAGP